MLHLGYHFLKVTPEYSTKALTTEMHGWCLEAAAGGNQASKAGDTGGEGDSLLLGTAPSMEVEAAMAMDTGGRRGGRLLVASCNGDVRWLAIEQQQVQVLAAVRRATGTTAMQARNERTTQSRGSSGAPSSDPWR